MALFAFHRYRENKMQEAMLCTNCTCEVTIHRGPGITRERVSVSLLYFERSALLHWRLFTGRVCLDQERFCLCSSHFTLEAYRTGFILTFSFSLVSSGSGVEKLLELLLIETRKGKAGLTAECVNYRGVWRFSACTPYAIVPGVCRLLVDCTYITEKVGPGEGARGPG